MKKIYISADIEGIWGNANPANTMKSGIDYAEYQTNMIHEVNLLIDTLFAHGVEEVLVNDSHGNMDNILASQLDPRASIVVSNGAYKAYGMMEGLDSSFDGVCFVGYHCRSNTPGVMAHTIWGSMVSKIELDGQELGESGLNAHLAWEYGVPVVLIAGDDLLHQQLQEEISYPYAYVETKKAHSFSCAVCCSWNTLKERYKTAVHQMEELCTYRPNSKVEPHTLHITFKNIVNADFVARMDGVERISNCTVEIKKQSYDALYQYMRFVIKVCNAFQ